MQNKVLRLAYAVLGGGGNYGDYGIRNSGGSGRVRVGKVGCSFSGGQAEESVLGRI